MTDSQVFSETPFAIGGSLSIEAHPKPVFSKTAPELPMVTQTVTRLLTESELTEKRKRYADVGIEAARAVEEFKAVKEAQKLIVAGLRLEAYTLLKHIEEKTLTENRVVYRDVNRSYLTVTLIDVLTGEVLETRPLTVIERQEILGFEDPC